ncbi:MAG: hypothetical protein KC636_38270 [Myxococcales bacterium]|nr:hypothetical protein [Myxococcales bacterium]
MTRPTQLGTRALVVFAEGEPGAARREVAVLWVQYDGYPAGLGRRLVSCLKGKVVADGDTDAAARVSGVGDLAAQVIAYLKGLDAVDYERVGTRWEAVQVPVNRAGGHHLYASGARDLGEEYVYTLVCPPRTSSERGEGRLWLEVVSAAEGALFSGWLDDYAPVNP